MMGYKEIESAENPAVRHAVRLSREKKYRLASGEMVLEGGKLLAEALASGVIPRDIFIDRERAPCPESALLEKAAAGGARLFHVPARLLNKLSNVETPQGIVFTCPRPVKALDTLIGARRLVILEALQDPGNLGAVLRSADAFGIDGVILAGGCTDVSAPKVARATMGAIFRLPLVQAELSAAIPFLKKQGLCVYAAALRKDSVPVTKAALSKSCVIIGNEGRGVSAQALELCDKSIIIPMEGQAESLNAASAAAILMWEMSRGGL